VLEIILQGHILSTAGGALRSAPLMLSIWPMKMKWNGEKSKHAVSAEQYGCGPAFFHKMLSLVIGTEQL